MSSDSDVRVALIIAENGTGTPEVAEKAFDDLMLRLIGMQQDAMIWHEVKHGRRDERIRIALAIGKLRERLGR